MLRCPHHEPDPERNTTNQTLESEGVEMELIARHCDNTIKFQTSPHRDQPERGDRSKRCVEERREWRPARRRQTHGDGGVNRDVPGMSQSLLLLLSFRPRSRLAAAPGWSLAVSIPTGPHNSDAAPLPVRNFCSRHLVVCILLLSDGRASESRCSCAAA